MASLAAAASSSSASSLMCPICAEDMSLVFRKRSCSAIGRSCCGQMVCQSCMYRHIRSVMEEGLTGGGGRKSIVCPLGCGRPVTDKDIRSCFHRQHSNFLEDWLGALVFWFWVSLTTRRLWPSHPNYDTHYYERWFYWSHGRKERQDLQRYEQWSLALGMIALRGEERRSASSSLGGEQQEQQLIQCPAPNCDHCWVVAHPDFRRAKQVHEGQGYYFYYSTLSTKEPKLPFDWVRPEYMSMHRFSGRSNDVVVYNEDLDTREIQRDSRYLACGKCRTSFCTLCRQPWRVSPSLTHQGLSCSSYLSRLRSRGLAGDDDYVFNAQAMDARMCPRCSMRTLRTEGCNHMTCPCGMEWCYICECRWNPSHYGCVESSRRRDGGTTMGCVIS